MKVTDLNGFQIEIIDLNEAMRIISEFKEYSHVDKNFSEFDKRQKIYWTDMYEKLSSIKKQVDKN